MCLDVIFFVIILHGVYSASWICGLVFSSILENSLSPVILLKALLNFSATQPRVCFQNWQLPQRQGDSFGGLATLSTSLFWTPHPTMSHCLWGFPKALKPILCCSVFLVPQQEVWSNNLVESKPLYLVFVTTSYFLKLEYVAGLPTCKIEFKLVAASQHEHTPKFSKRFL